MKISIREFIDSVLRGARSLDEVAPHLTVEKLIWLSWRFDDHGAHYIEGRK